MNAPARFEPDEGVRTEGVGFDARSTLRDLAEVARAVREAAMKDKTYRATPLGQEVGHYIRWKRNEWGARPETLRDYEPILANLALHFPDYGLAEFDGPQGTDRLREAWDARYGERTERTRGKVLSVYRDFFSWAGRERGMIGNPADRIRRPKTRDVDIETFSKSFVKKVIAAQDYPADIIGAILILKYGLRRSGLVNAQLRDFDVERRMLRVKTKGGRIHWLPITDERVWLQVGELQLLGCGPEAYLLYRSDTRRRKVDLADATELVEIAGTPIGYADVTTRTHDRLVVGKTAHQWWYRCLVRAGVVPKGVTSGTNMHRGRHTSATELLRSSHNLKLTQALLGHTDIRSTTRYAQLDTDDLAAALAGLYGEDDEG